MLIVMDDFSKESPMLLADNSLSGLRVIRALDELPALPRPIQIDNGPEFISKAMLEWVYRRGIRPDLIRLGKPTDNAFIESFNGKFREECLNQHWFIVLKGRQRNYRTWRRECNEVRPHSSLGHLLPAEFAKQSQLRLTA